MSALGSDPSTSGAKPAAAAWRLSALSPAAIAFGAIAAIALIFAFVGLNATAFDVDELFTIYLIDHAGGLGEVFNRALGDTHPPLYYFLLYEWTRFTPLTETMLRLPSALLSCGAVLMFVIGLRKDFSLAALMFAAALAALSGFFFAHSQYARDYGLALFGSACVVAAASALHRGLAAGKATGALIAIALAGLVGSLSHSYVLLQTGMTLLFAMLFWTKSWRMRAAIAGIGVVILAVNVAYFAALMHATKEDLHDLWFENSWGAVEDMLRGTFLGVVTNGAEIAVLGLLGVIVWRWLRRQPQAGIAAPTAPGAQLARFAWFVFFGTMLCAIAISLIVAPSLSQRNLLTTSPFLWVLLARLYDKTAGRWRGRTMLAGVGLLVALVATNMASLPGRLLARGEDWRLAAKYIQALPGCAEAEVPAVQPYIFGPDNPHYREIARRYFYGWYLRKGEGVSMWMPAQIGGRTPAPHLMQTLADRAGAAGQPGACPLLVWGEHDIETIDALHIAEDLARLPQVAPNRVVIQEINSYRRAAFGWKLKPDSSLFLVAPKADGAPAIAQPQLTRAETRQVGDRLAVTLLSTNPAPDHPDILFDTFAVQRWRGDTLIGEMQDKVQRFTCDPKVKASERRAWPNLNTPGCSPIPAPDWPEHPSL